MLRVLKHPYAIGVLAVIFVAAHLYGLSINFPFLIALPFAILGAYALIYHPKPLLIFIVFSTPLSFNFENLGSLGGIGFYFPTEPLLFALMLLYIVKILTGYRESKDLINHPLSIAIILNLTWIAITAVTSELPVVSFKFLLSRLWFVLVMYFMINQLFRDERYIKKFMAAYLVGLVVAIVYTIITHASHGFNEEAGHWVMWPFFKDHTSYGAILALFFPTVVFLFFNEPKKSVWKMLFLGLLGLFTIAVILSYTRAAWVSLLGALGVWVLIKLRIDYKVVIAGILLLLGAYFGFEDQILHRLEKNRQDSSDNLTEHVQSITNISSDASNLERLNRWNSALRMFEAKPILGHGPGTYMFEYAKYQKSSDKTIISTNQGDGGNAHSEYLGPLSEQGIPGALFTLIVFILSLTTGIRIYYKLDHNRFLKGLTLSIVLGLVTYYLHGILNNYLDTDKASVPIWGMMSILVAIELYHLKGGSVKPTAE
jgi:O-antigen ligase